MKRRRLDDEEASLWAHVAKTVKPLPGRVFDAPARLDKAKPATEAEHRRPAPELLRRSPPLAAMDRRTRTALKRGTERVDAVLDLHGHYQDEAFRALRRFLADAQTKHYRFVLVVTGKGGAETPSGGRGVLKRMVPLWLRAPDMRGFVVGFEEAAQRHGGAGAVYVRVRRGRGHGGAE